VHAGADGLDGTGLTLNLGAAEAASTLALLPRRETRAAELAHDDLSSDTRASMLAVMHVPKDAPSWLVELVRPHWGAPEWNAWEDYRE
jgi:hypothetical protein